MSLIAWRNLATKCLLREPKHSLSGAVRHFLDHIRKRDKFNKPTLLNKHMCTLSILSARLPSQASVELMIWLSVCRLFVLKGQTEADSQSCAPTVDTSNLSLCLVWKLSSETFLPCLSLFLFGFSDDY